MLNTFWTLILLIIFALLAVSSSDAFAVEKKFQWTTRITVSEQYDDNINLTSDEGEEEDDWITRVGPGLTLAVLFEKTEASLNYDLAISYYAKHQDNNGASHRLTLSGLKDIPIAEHWTLDLEESFLAAEDPLAVGDQSVSVQRSRNRYYRNSAGAGINYLFGENDSLYASVNHSFLFSNDNDVEESQRLGASAGINYWFNIRHGLNLDYGYATAILKDSDDFDQHTGRATYSYRFSPKTQTDLYYSYLSMDFDGDENDYVVHSGGLGFTQQITEHYSWSILGGYFYRDVEEDDNNEGFVGSASLSRALEKGSLNFNAAAGYREQYIEAENLGFSRYYRASVGLNYSLLEKLTTNISGFYQRDEYKATIRERNDDTWLGRIGLSYLLLPWLSGSLSYQYRERQSTEKTEEYQDNRIIFSLVAFYSSEPKPF